MGLAIAIALDFSVVHAQAQEPRAAADASEPPASIEPITTKDTPSVPLHWEHVPFSTADYLATSAAAGITLAMAIAAPQTHHARGGVLFDDAVRDTLRLKNASARYVARDASDVGLSLAATWPIFVDSLTTAWWYRGSREIAQEMALIDLEALALAGAVQGVTNVSVSRERPYGRDCGGAVPSDTGDCDGTGRFRSFFSGHSAFSFTSAALICSHHMELELLGSPYDALTCATGYAVAASTATLRIVGDMHYATDVLTGAVVGTLIGYGVPFLHRRRASASRDAASIHIVPTLGGAGLGGTF